MAIQMVDLNNSQQLETLICSIDEYLKTECTGNVIIKYE